MNTENLFKLYYIAWHQRNKTREYAELGCLEKNLETYETILLKRNIDEYISNYVDSAYLDIWKKVCTKKKDYFLSIINKNITDIVEDASNLLIYLSSKDIIDFYAYKGADFIFNGDNYEPSRTRTYKNLLLICQKLDLELYNNILKYIKTNIKLTKLDAPIVKDLWNTLNMDSTGKVYSTTESYLALERLSNNPELSNETNDFYNTLIYLDKNKNNNK